MSDATVASSHPLSVGLAPAGASTGSYKIETNDRTYHFGFNGWGAILERWPSISGATGERRAWTQLVHCYYANDTVRLHWLPDVAMGHWPLTVKPEHDDCSSCRVRTAPGNGKPATCCKD